MSTPRLAIALLGSLALCLAACSKEEAQPEATAAAKKPAKNDVAQDVTTDHAAQPSDTRPADPADPAAPAATGTLRLTVRGLHCEEACVPRLERMLSAAPGVRSVTVDYGSGTATVAVTGDADAAAVAAAVGGGFVAQVD